MNRRRDLAIDLALAAGIVLLWAARALPRLTTHLRDGYDALFHAWNAAWVRHALAAEPLRLFDANMFAPLPGTLAFSDPFLGCGLLSALFAPLGPVAALNLAALLLAVLSLFAVVRLARSLGASRAAAALGAAAACLGPFLAATFGYFPFSAFGGIALLALAWRRLLEKTSWRAATLLGLAAGLFGLVSLQLLALAAVGVGLLALVDIARTRPPLARLAPRLLLAGAIALLLTAPAALPLLAVRRAGGLEQSPAEMLRFSAHASDWRQGLFPGFAALALAVVAVVAARRHRALLPGALLALAGFALSFGPRGPGWLLVHGPLALVFGSVRSFDRFAFVAQTGLALLAAAGIDALAARAGRAPRWRAVWLAAVALGVALSARTLPAPAYRVPPRPESAALADRLPAPALHLPFRARAADARWLFDSIPAFRPLVNGYTSFNPPAHEALAAALQGPRLGEEMLARLAAWPVRTLVVHEHALPAGSLAPTLDMVALGVHEGRISLVATTRHGPGLDDVLVFGGAGAADPASLLARAGAAVPIPVAAESDFYAALEEPEEGAAVRGELRVKGWSRTEAGDSVVADVTVDGERRPALSSARGARPDVCAALPKLAPCDGAGYELRFALAPEEAGEHVLHVVFVTPDGRVRTLARRFRAL